MVAKSLLENDASYRRRGRAPCTESGMVSEPYGSDPRQNCGICNPPRTDGGLVVNRRRPVPICHQRVWDRARRYGLYGALSDPPRSLSATGCLLATDPLVW
jgi:hypothetical protein